MRTMFFVCLLILLHGCSCRPIMEDYRYPAAAYGTLEKPIIMRSRNSDGSITRSYIYGIHQ